MGGGFFSPGVCPLYNVFSVLAESFRLVWPLARVFPSFVASSPMFIVVDGCDDPFI